MDGRVTMRSSAMDPLAADSSGIEKFTARCTFLGAILKYAFQYRAWSGSPRVYSKYAAMLSTSRSDKLANEMACSITGKSVRTLRTKDSCREHK